MTAKENFTKGGISKKDMNLLNKSRTLSLDELIAFSTKNFKNRVVIDKESDWEVPAGVIAISVSGCAAGGAGENGVSTNASSPKGGKAGEYIFNKRVEVTPGIKIHCVVGNGNTAFGTEIILASNILEYSMTSNILGFATGIDGFASFEGSDLKGGLGGFGGAFGFGGGGGGARINAVSNVAPNGKGGAGARNNEGGNGGSSSAGQDGSSSYGPTVSKGGAGGPHYPGYGYDGGNGGNGTLNGAGGGGGGGTFSSTSSGGSAGGGGGGAGGYGAGGGGAGNGEGKDNNVAKGGEGSPGIIIIEW